MTLASSSLTPSMRSLAGHPPRTIPRFRCLQDPRAGICGVPARHRAAQNCCSRFRDGNYLRNPKIAFQNCSTHRWSICRLAAAEPRCLRRARRAAPKRGPRSEFLRERLRLLEAADLAGRLTALLAAERAEREKKGIERLVVSTPDGDMVIPAAEIDWIGAREPARSGAIRARASRRHRTARSRSRTPRTGGCVTRRRAHSREPQEARDAGRTFAATASIVVAVRWCGVPDND